MSAFSKLHSGPKSLTDKTCRFVTDYLTTNFLLCYPLTPLTLIAHLPSGGPGFAQSPGPSFLLLLLQKASIEYESIGSWQADKNAC